MPAVSKRMHVCQQVFEILLAEHLAVPRHLGTAIARDFRDPLVVRRQAAQSKIRLLEHTLEARSLLATGRVRLMATVTVPVINTPSGGLLRAKSELRVTLTAFSGTSKERNEEQR